MLNHFGRKETGKALQVIVFMTDGDWTTAYKDPKPMADTLKKEGVIIIVITVGYIRYLEKTKEWASIGKGVRLAFDIQNFKEFGQLAHYLHKGKLTILTLTL